jgi:hypothetical protein
MKHTPKWVWIQRAAVANFLMSFYFRRSLNLVFRAVPGIRRRSKPAVQSQAFPRRYRIAETIKPTNNPDRLNA